MNERARGFEDGWHGEERRPPKWPAAMAWLYERGYRAGASAWRLKEQIRFAKEQRRKAGA